MNSNDIIAAIEIGTSKTALAVAEPTESGLIRISAHCEIPSSGIRKSQITDIDGASASISAVLKRITNESPDVEFTIRDAALVVSGQHIRTNRRTSQWQTGGTVTEDDITEVRNRACETGIDESERVILDISELDYGLDGTSGIASPKGLSGRLLKLDSVVTHGSKMRIDDAKKAAAAATLEFTDFYFSGIAAAAAVLTPEDRENGTAVIDLGAGSTSFAVYANRGLLHAGTIGIGGDHVTNDIGLAFSVSHNQAEELKLKASAVITGDHSKRIPVPRHSVTDTGDETISAHALNTVVNARLSELFTLVRDEFSNEDVLQHLNGGIVLTGGVAYTAGITELAQNIFGCSVRIGKFISGIESASSIQFPASLAAVVGTLLLQSQRDDGDDNSLLSPLFGTIKRIFGK